MSAPAPIAPSFDVDQVPPSVWDIDQLPASARVADQVLGTCRAAGCAPLTDRRASRRTPLRQGRPIRRSLW